MLNWIKNVGVGLGVISVCVAALFGFVWAATNYDYIVWPLCLGMLVVQAAWLFGALIRGDF